MTAPFALDKPNGKLMGVCAGLARSSGVDPTVLRVLLLLSILFLGWLTIPAYFAAGLLAPQRA